ncbi:MAG: heparan-alpha-glucosaminide N-acetyltransferase domain-containing protein [Nocardioides sp.]
MTGRLVGLDVARCVALIGMVATHTLAARTGDGDLAFGQWLAGGRASALFAVLAGVSLALITGREQPVRGRARIAASAGLVVRALLIAALGLALGELESGLAVILTYYGLLFLLGVPFVGLGARPLFVLAGVWAVVLPVLSHLVRPELPERRFDNPTLGQLGDPSALLSELAFTGYYPVLPWLAYLLVGMAVGRLALSRRDVQRRLAVAGLGLVVGATVVSRVLTRRADVVDPLRADFGGDLSGPDLLDTIAGGLHGTTSTGGPWQWLLVVAPHSATPFDLAQTIGSALAAIGACLLLVGVLPRFGERAAAVVFGAGTATLSLYSLHVVLHTEDFWPPDGGAAAFRWHALVLLWLGAGLVAFKRRGPLEVVVGSASRATADVLRGRGAGAGTPR